MTYIEDCKTINHKIHSCRRFLCPFLIVIAATIIAIRDSGRIVFRHRGRLEINYSITIFIEKIITVPTT